MQMPFVAELCISKRSNLDNMDWIQFFSALLGGLLTLAGSIITTLLSNKHSDKKWKKDQKYSVYCELIQELKTVKIPCLVTNEAINNQQLILDVEEINSKLEKLGEFIEENLANIYIFAPKGIYNNLIRLQSEIYSIISNVEYQRVNLTDFKKSKIYTAVLDAQSIAKTLKDDLLKN